VPDCQAGGDRLQLLQARAEALGCPAHLLHLFLENFGKASHSIPQADHLLLEAFRVEFDSPGRLREKDTESLIRVKDIMIGDGDQDIPEVPQTV